MSTKINPRDIKPVDVSSYNNLKEEILDVKSSISSSTDIIKNTINEFNDTAKLVQDNITIVDEKIDTLETTVETIKEGFENIIINVDTVKEVVDAREGFDTLNSRLEHIEGMDIFKGGVNLSNERSYIYNSEGFITKETVVGDLNYEILYEYDTSNNIISEAHYYNNSKIGHKEYTYNSDGNITKVISDNADVMEMVTSKGTEIEQDKRIAELESVQASDKIDYLMSHLLIGPYDGKALSQQVNGMDTRVRVIEDLMPSKIYDILDLPNIIKRLDTLEYLLSTSKNVCYFIYVEGVNTYELPTKTITGAIKLYVEGISLSEGLDQDFILLEDKQTIQFFVPVIPGCQIMCEYH